MPASCRSSIGSPRSSARTEDPQAALQTILGELVALFHATSGSIALAQSGHRANSKWKSATGLPPDTDDVALRLGQGITGWVAFHGRPQLVPDVAADPRYIALRPDVRCEMAAPMEAQGQVIGVINLDSDLLGGFTEADLALLVRLTAEATTVVQRLWQLRQLQGKARQLETLITIGQSLVSKLEEQELFDTVTREARQIMSARLCALYLHDSARGTARLVSVSGPATPPAGGAGAPPLPKDDLPLDHCLIASVLHTRRQIEFHNVQSPEYADVIDLPRDESLHSLLAAPLLFEDEAIGVLGVFTDKPHRFNNDEKRLLGALASLGAVAIQNSRLYTRVFQSEESLRKNERLTTLGLLAAEIAHEIRNPLTVIKLLYGYLNLDFPEDDPRRKDTQVISEKLDQLEAIVTRVLNFAKAPVEPAFPLVRGRDHRGHHRAHPAEARPGQDPPALRSRPRRRSSSTATRASSSRCCSTCCSTPCRSCRTAAKSPSAAPPGIAAACRS